ncbi:LysR substrate-binding domain-containing protein [Roseibium algae]|uniref:LysR substrate-binding domain-containing protein n=1 Tax=Roseibium algae TaxID=3123038 RepID=A0ABU8TS99_9HYPH
MELGWLEDFVELAAVRNFSTAAAARSITQPAFSRRIQALENWVGAELVDRSSFPVSLTKPGEVFLEASRGLIKEIYRLRDECRQQADTGIEVLSFSALHTIALSIFPDLLRDVEQEAGSFVSRMNATDYYDCVEALALGRCDVALCYSHKYGPPVLQTGQFISKKIATDPFLLVCACDSDRSPLFALPERGKSEPFPLVAYSLGCFLGKVQSDLLRQLRSAGMDFNTVFENSMSEAVKRMVLSGKGIGWLPRSAAQLELQQGLLTCLEIDQAPVDLNVLAFRKTATGSAVMERFWSHLPEFGSDVSQSFLT